MADIVVKSSMAGNFTILSNEFTRNPDVTPRAAKVFMYLMSNSEGWATSAQRIAKIINMGETTVGHALRDLEELGYLKRERKNIDGGRFKWEYELYATPITMDGKASNGATSGNSASPQVGTIGQKTTDGKTTDGNLSNIRRTTPKKTNLQEEQENTSSSADEPGESDDFKDFWENYPRKIGKGKARERYQEQLETASPDVLLDAVKNFAEECRVQQTEKRYIPYPSTWLNQGRWKDYGVAPKPAAGKVHQASMWAEEYMTRLEKEGNYTHDELPF